MGTFLHLPSSDEERLGLGDGDVGGPAALVALDGEDLVVVRAQGQAGLGPGVKVVLDGDGAADAVVAADGPVLVEGGCALDAGLVDALGLVDVVRVAVGGDRRDLGGYFSCVLSVTLPASLFWVSCG